MHASKGKRGNSTAVEVTSTSVGCVADSAITTDEKTTTTAYIVSPCNTIQYDKDTWNPWTKLLSDATVVSTHVWSKKQRQVNCNQKCHHLYRGPQQTTKKLYNRSGSQSSSAVVEFDFSQPGKHLLVNKNERSLVTSKAHENSSARENCYCNRIVCQSYRNLKLTSTQQRNTASSSLPSRSVRFRNPTTHHYRYQQRGRCIFYPNLKLFVYWHAFSLLTYFAATGLCVRATVSESFLNLNDMKHTENANVPDILLLKQSSKHLTSMSSSVTTADDSTSSRTNPLLRHYRSTSVRLGLALDSVCYIWSSVAPNDLCKLAPWARYQYLRKISIFNRDCLEENNIKASQLFRLTPRYISSEADLRIQAKFLRASVDGQDCILAPAGAQQCLSCFQKIDRALKTVDKAYDKFNLTLHRFDCMLAVDTASATRPFSPNGSCTDCKIWYRKWLVVHSLNLWSAPPCINWCYYVQLACPHLATSKVVDYAGHPSFQCRDLHIPSVSTSQDPDSMKSTTVTSATSKKKSAIASKCACLHPCDLEEFYNLVSTTRTAEQNRSSSYSNIFMKSNEEEDFFPSPQHCMDRRYLCGTMKNEAEGHRVVRRSLTKDISTASEKLRNFKLVDISLSNYVFSVASVLLRWTGSTGVVLHRNNAIQQTFNDRISYAYQWWSKHRARRHSQFNKKTVTSITTNSEIPSTATAVDSTTVFTFTSTTVSSGVDWEGTKWSICSGISIYTLFFSLLLLRRPPLI